MDATAAQTVTVQRHRRACPPAPCTCGARTSTPASSSNWFVHSADITPSGGSFSLTVQPGLRVLADHHHRAGQGHRGEPGAGHPGPAVLRQLRLRHRRAAAALPGPAAGRVRGGAVRGRPVRAVPAAAGRRQADRVGRRRQPLHDRRQPVLGQLHRRRRRADPAGRGGPVARPGEHAEGLRPGGHRRLLLPGRQHRRMVDLPQQHQRHDHHAGQRHAWPRSAPAPGTTWHCPSTAIRSAGPSTAPRWARSPTAPSPTGWSAWGSTATRPTSSTTCR